MERENEKLKKMVAETGDQAKISIAKLTSLEIDNEGYER